MLKSLKNWIGDDIDSLNSVRSGKLNNLDKFFLITFAVFAALLYIPLIGNFYFIDPWENHYSHVAWETLEKGSIAKLWYQNSNKFWSKPPLLFWMLMPFYKIQISEFMGRLPIALFSILTLVGFYILLTKLFSRRVAMLSTCVLLLSPQYFMLSRQVMVDLPFIGLNTIATLCLAQYYIGNNNDSEYLYKIQKRDLYLYLFYFFEGWAFLAKGLLSAVIPGITLFVFMILVRDFSLLLSWKHLKKHIIGAFIYLAVIMPWFGYMMISEGKSFFDTFIIYHHFKRTAGVIHKSNDLYTLYVRILAYSLFPWSAFLPAALYNALTKIVKNGNEDDEIHEKRKILFIFASFVGPFFFLAFSSTKFYHYISPVVPFLAIFVGIYLDKFCQKGWTLGTKIEAVAAILLLGVIGKDLGNDHTLFLDLVTFYNTRKVPWIGSWVYVTSAVFALFGLLIFLMIFSDKIKKAAFYSLFILSAGFMTYYLALCLPKISEEFSLKPHVEAYLKDSPERAPIADYYKWLRKSAGFWLKNEITFLHMDKDKSVLRFFEKPGVQYVILRKPDKKRFDSLMKRINKRGVNIYEGGQNLLLKVEGEGKKRDFTKAKEYIVSELPPDLIKIGANIDNSIILEGLEFTSNKPEFIDGKYHSKEGKNISVNLYFRSIANKITKDYDVFLHTEGDKKDKRTKSDGNIANGTYPTPFWKNGEIIRHPVTIKIPENTANSYYTSYAGLYQEEYRGNIKNTDQVANDGNNRVEILKIYLDK